MLLAAIKLTAKAAALCLIAAAGLTQAQGPQPQHLFDGTWQMDSAKSHVNDGRIVEAMTIQSVTDGVKFTLKTKKANGQEVDLEFTGKVNGDASEIVEGSHKSKLMMWYNGPTLNASKENGPPDDVTSMWKFELSPDKQTMSLKINHYEPAAGDETLVFSKKG